MSSSNLQPALEFRNVVKIFGKGDVRALDDVNLTVAPGRILGVIGYSGAGKSTLIRMINGLETPTSGDVVVGGRTISGLPERKLRPLRSDIGMIFQHFNLFTSRTAAGNIEYPLELAGMRKSERKKRAAELLEFVGLGDKGRSYPEQLSGGQKQRVGIARALATNPSLLLADEATSALDPETTRDVLDLLRRINKELGTTIVLITHDMSVIRAIADEVAVMEGGRVMEAGPVRDVLAHPTTETGRRFADMAMRDLPTGRERDSLLRGAASASRADATSRLITAAVGDDVDLGELLAVARDRGVTATVAHGAVTSLQATSFGRLTLRLTGAKDDVDAAVAGVAGLTTVEELS
ncbi:methionine ABC transporter ATP-binding protein [Corynebacterium sp. 335C]